MPPLALDERIYGDYDQLKRLFYVFFFKTPHAAAVVAADDMAFLDRLWADWSPGYDAAADLGYAKQCLRAPEHLAAAATAASTSRSPPTPSRTSHRARAWT